MDLGITGRVALVTGGSKGIGGASARLLAREGAKLAIAARTQAELETNAERIRRETGAEVLALATDCTDPTSVQATVERVATHFGRIDILVNSIGSARAGDFLALSEEDWQQSLALKLMGQIRVAKAVYPHMKKGGWGRIVNVIGTHAVFAEAHAMPAGVANAGLMNFTKALAEMGGPDGILVNAVSPGTVRTARLEYLMSKGVTYDLSRITLGRFAEPEELANVIVFLCSQCVSYMCGAYVHVDGGQIKTI